MAPGSFVPIDEVQAALTADWGSVAYLGSSSYHGGARFQNGMASASVHTGGDQLTGDVPVDMSSLVASIGMTPAGFEMPDGGLANTGFGAVGGVVVPAAEGAMPRQPQPGSNNKPPTSHKAVWTVEEDR
jgi:hypothetical protein